MKKSSYFFKDDGDNGYEVELIYQEEDRRCFVISQNRHEEAIDNFTITKDIIAEMRRTKASKAIITFGYSDFNVFELVNLLNEIKSQTYQYGVNDGSSQQKKEAS